MTRLLTGIATLAVALLFDAAPAAAQHHGGSGSLDSLGVTEAFEVSGFRVDDAAPPAGSAIGRAGLRFDDGGYVAVTYGKPYRRGRTIFGGLVGYGQVWAAGAHRSTELVTTVPLMLGGTRVLPGAYSVFAVPGERSWTVHLNRRLGMHLADEYDAAEDLTVTQVPVETLDEPEEALTYRFGASSHGGHMPLALEIAWDTVVVRVPFARSDG